MNECLNIKINSINVKFFEKQRSIPPNKANIVVELKLLQKYDTEWLYWCNLDGMGWYNM